jgi:hypothetical protein
MIGACGGDSSTGDGTTTPVFPPDALLDVTQVDGLPATLHVELLGDGETAVFDAEVVLQVPSDLSPDTCFGAG